MPSTTWLIQNTILTKSSHHILALGTDAELAAPDADARRYIELGIAALMATPRTFIDMIGNPGDGPYLSTMGVATHRAGDLIRWNTSPYYPSDP